MTASELRASRRRSGITAISERQLQDGVIAAAQALKWKVTHFRPSLNQRGAWSTALQGDPGFFDLVLCRNGVTLFVELKSATGKLTRDQEEWAVAAGDRAVVWRPDDWTSGRILEMLR